MGTNVLEKLVASILRIQEECRFLQNVDISVPNYKTYVPEECSHRLCGLFQYRIPVILLVYMQLNMFIQFMMWVAFKLNYSFFILSTCCCGYVYWTLIQIFTAILHMYEHLKYFEHFSSFCRKYDLVYVHRIQGPIACSFVFLKECLY